MSEAAKTDKKSSSQGSVPANKSAGQPSFNASSSTKNSREDVAKLTEVPKNISSSVLDLIPESVARKYNIAAFSRVGKVVKVAILDPSDINALNALRFVAEKEKVEIEVYKADDKLLQDILDKYGGATEAVREAIQSFKSNTVVEEGGSAERRNSPSQEVLKEAPVAKLVEVIISHAIDGKASDIHIEPMDRDYRVRFRVDGILHVSLIIPKEIGPAIISRIKILASLKIDEKRKPQDGRFRITNDDGREVDFRVSTLPVITGEKVVLRILDKDQGLASIEALGLLGTALENMKRAINETYGMILFTGPTGSGKSTSLYALLKILNNEERNIITLEDPIEYDIEGLNQSQINPEIGYTFASGLRTILRQDPNVIMVGEIRDNETAELAVHAALTGHLMFSTLHTNTAIGAVPRLMDMGIEPFLLTSSLRIVVAQRLVRRICSKCKEEIPMSTSVIAGVKKELEKVSPKELEKYKLDLSGGLKFFHGKGCDVCNGTGLKGRVAIYEAVPVNDNIRNIITEHNGSEDLLDKEREAMGAITIRQDGVLKMLLGLTTLEEVERVTEGNITLLEEND